MNLTHRRILITRPRAQAEEFASALIAERAHPIFFPVIEITPLSERFGIQVLHESNLNMRWELAI